MIPRFRPSLGWKEILSLFLPASDKNIIKFEEKFAKKMSQNYAVAFPYGRTALIALLKIFDFERKEIICPSYTCVVVAHAIVESGNIPVFVDSNEFDFNMDFKHVESLINENTAAIIATSIFGYPVNLGAIERIQKKYPHIKIFQDCAHSFSAKWNGRPVNKHGDAAFFGLNASKIITTIFGGIITTDSNEIRNKLLKFRNESIKPASFKKRLVQRLYLFAFYFAFKDSLYFFVNWLERKGFLGRLSQYYDEIKIDLPNDYLEMMTPTGARVGIIQLDKYEAILSNREKIAEYYSRELANIPGLKLPPMISGATYSHYVVRVDAGFRWKLIDNCIKNGVQLGWLIEYSIPEMKVYRERFTSNVKCPISFILKDETINLPLNTSNPKKVISVLTKAMKRVGSVYSNYSV